MSFNFNFYVLGGKAEDSYKELWRVSNTDNIIYLTLQVGDIVIIPTSENHHYIINKVIKNLSSSEFYVYASKINIHEDNLKEMEILASKTINTVMGAIKSERLFDLVDKNSPSSQQ